MFFKRVFVIDFHTVTEHDGVRHLHHGRFHVQREQDACFAAVFQFFFVEVAQGFFAHEHRVNDFAVLQRYFFFQYDGFTTVGDEFHFHIAGAVQSDGFFAMVEVAFLHV